MESTTGRFCSHGLARNASLELETHSGADDLQLPMKMDAEIDAATITGGLDNQGGSRTSVRCAGREAADGR